MTEIDTVLEDEIMKSWKKVAGEALKGKGDEAAMDEVDRLAQIVRNRRKERKE